MNIECVESFEKAKDNLFLRLKPVEGNEELLEKCPHRIIGDIAELYCILVENDGEAERSVVITHEIAAMWGVDELKIASWARLNAATIKPAKLENMSDALNRLMGRESFTEPAPMWIGNVESEIGGAACICYGGFLDMAADIIGHDLFIIPSSVHEVIFYQDDGTMHGADIENIICDVNATEVAPEDKLSDTLYHYCRADGRLETAESFDERRRKAGKPNYFDSRNRLKQ